MFLTSNIFQSLKLRTGTVSKVQNQFQPNRSASTPQRCEAVATHGSATVFLNKNPERRRPTDPISIRIRTSGCVVEISIGRKAKWIKHKKVQTKLKPNV